jgi:ribonuclease E
MSENLSNIEELPVITDIADLPESAIEELTSGVDSAEVTKPATKAATKPNISDAPESEESAVVEDNSDKVAAEEVKPKRKRRTKAEIEAEKAEEVAKDE